MPCWPRPTSEQVRCSGQTGQDGQGPKEIASAKNDKAADRPAAQGQTRATAAVAKNDKVQELRKDPAQGIQHVVQANETCTGRTRYEISLSSCVASTA